MGWRKSKNTEAKAGATAPPGGQIQRAAGSHSGVRPAPKQVKKSLPQLLLEEGKVSQEQLERLMEKQKETGVFIGELLVEEGLFEEQSLISFLAKYCKIPHLSLLDYLIDTDIIELIPEDVCLEFRLLPIDKLGSNLTVAMVNPLDTRALEKVKSLCPELRIKPILCAYKHFEAVTQKVFGRKTKNKVKEMSVSSFGLQIPKVAPPAKTAPVEPEARKEAERTPASAVAKDSVLAPAPVPEPELLPQPAAEAVATVSTETPNFNSDAIMDNVFQILSDDSTPVAEAEPEDSLGGIMEEMASVMMDSMRDTYDMLARRVELFNGLKPDEVAKIFARGDTIEAEEGQVLFEKGQPGDNMYIILGGSVQIYDGGQEIAKLKRGGMFGEMALVSSEPRSASARAMESSSLLALNIDVIREVMPREVSVQLLINIVVTLSERLRQANKS